MTQIIAVLVVMIAVPAMVDGNSIASATTTISLGDLTCDPGGTVTAEVMLKDVQNYGTGTMNITYKPAVVHVTGVTGNTNSTVITYNEDNTAGVVTISAWNTGGVSGDIEFASVTFEAVGTGSTLLGLGVAKLRDTSMTTPIPFEISNGSITISGGNGGTEPQLPFVIDGHVSNSNGDPCNNPWVRVTNVNTSASWDAENSSASNDYLLVLDSDDVRVDDVLQFETVGCSLSKIASHAISQAEIDAGGFGLDIMLESSDETAPTISDHSPTGTAEPVTTDVTVTFNEAMNETAAEGAFSIDPTVTGAFDWSGNTMTFDPNVDLGCNTLYNITIGTGAKDLAGNPLAEPFSWEFTTAEYVTPSTTVSIEDVTVAAGGFAIVPIMVNNVVNLGGCIIDMVYNASVVHVTNVTPGDMDLLVSTFDNGTGWMYANAINASEFGMSGDVVFAYVNFTAVGVDGDASPLNITVGDGNLFDVNFSAIDHTVINGTFTIGAEDGEPPLVTNASASRDTILNDNGRARAPGTNVTVLNVTVTDSGSGVANVTINLSSIGGSPVQPMEQIPETNIWTVTMNATAGINLTHQLTINATDNDGNYNDTVAIQLTVLRRGDVCRDDTIDHKDVMYIARYLAGLEPESSNPPTVLVGDVVGIAGDPEGDGVVNLMDALYIARYGAGLEIKP
jgi:hypothetical protein